MHTNWPTKMRNTQDSVHISCSTLCARFKDSHERDTFLGKFMNQMCLTNTL